MQEPAIVKALNNLKVPATIKWPNDIIINNKKISGILTELSAEMERINYVVSWDRYECQKYKVSDGELEDKATSIYKENYDLSRLEIVTDNYCIEFEKLYKDYIENNRSEETIECMQRIFSYYW